jgi:hypothetical protein
MLNAQNPSIILKHRHTNKYTLIRSPGIVWKALGMKQHQHFARPQTCKKQQNQISICLIFCAKFTAQWPSG